MRETHSLPELPFKLGIIVPNLGIITLLPLSPQV